MGGLSQPSSGKDNPIMKQMALKLFVLAGLLVSSCISIMPARAEPNGSSQPNVTFLLFSSDDPDVFAIAAVVRYKATDTLGEQEFTLNLQAPNGSLIKKTVLLPAVQSFVPTRIFFWFFRKTGNSYTLIGTRWVLNFADGSTQSGIEPANQAAYFAGLHFRDDNPGAAPKLDGVILTYCDGAKCSFGSGKVTFLTVPTLPLPWMAVGGIILAGWLYFVRRRTLARLTIA